MGLAQGLAGNGIQASTLGGSGGWNAPAEPSPLGASQTINFAGTIAWKDLIGTLTANLTVNVSNFVSGCRGLLIVQQPASGGPYTLTLNDGAGPVAVAIATSPNAWSFVYYETDATNLYASVWGGSSSFPSTTVATSGAAQTLTAPSSGEAAYDVTLSANCALTLAGGTAGNLTFITLKLRQPSSGGPWTVTWPTSVDWPSQSPPPLTATPSAYDVITLFTTNGGTSWTGTLAASAVQATGVPGAPVGLSASASSGQVLLNWTAPTSNGGTAITNYQILRSTSSGTETLLTTIGNVLTYTDSTVTNGTQYFYKVKAVNVIGAGAASGEVNATPVAPFVNDTFAGTAGTLVTAAHSGQVTGATWTAATYSAGTAPDISGTNTLAYNANNQNSFYLASGTKVSADYTVQATLTAASLINAITGLLGRASSSAQTFYVARYNQSQWELYKCIAGTYTLLGSFAQGLALSSTHTFQLVMAGTSISLVVDGSTVISATDSSITASGNVGIYMWQPNAGSQTTGFQLSNLTAT